MTIEANKALFRRVIEEIWDQGHTELFDELFDPNFINHSPVGDLTGDLAGLKASAVVLRSAFPDLRAVIDHMVAEGDMICGYSFMYATHVGEFMGIPGTGQRVSMPMYSTLRIAHGRVIERWGMFDGLGMFMQIGAKVIMPPTR